MSARRRPSPAAWVGLAAATGAIAIAAIAAPAGVERTAPILREPVASCAEVFPLGGGAAGLALPYCSNRSLGTRDERVRRLVVVVHGDARNATDYFAAMVAAARAAGADDVLVVAPQFLTADDSAAKASASAAYFTDNGWKQGDSSATAPLARTASIGSFDALDALLRSILTSGDFPNLQVVVLTGHSAGGQLVDRFAATSALEDHVGGTVAFRYVIANPSSYLYFDGRRPSRTGEGFAELSARERDRCPDFDTWKFGLEGLNAYAADAGAAAMVARYGRRDVVYLLGGDDTDADDSSIDRSCAAEWQGPNRLARGRLHFTYLGTVFGPGVYANHALSVVADVGHDGRAMYLAAPALAAVFGWTGPERG